MYREGFARCLDCDVELVEDLPVEEPEPYVFERTEPVCVWVATAVIDAELVVVSLRAHEVRAFAAGTGLEFFSEAGAIGQVVRLPGPLNSIRIMVHPDDEDAARAFLATPAPAEPEPYDEALPPPRWTVDPDARRRAVKISALVLLLTGVPWLA